MATENRLQTASLPASADLSASQYCFVKNSSGQLAVASDGGADAIGILQDKPAAAGRAGAYAFGGVSKVLAGGSFNAGARISCDASGKAVAVGTGDTGLGTAEAAGTNGLITSVLLDRG